MKLPATAPRPPGGKRQRGAALLVLMVALGLLAAYFAINALSRSSLNERNRLNANVMAQAKEALIGFAATYRDNAPTHVNQVFGYLPCPDLDNNGGTGGVGGVASTSPACPNQNISTTGRLPWNTLGLPALRDNAGECLWYAVSGTAKDVNKTAAFNWDTLGQFIVRDAGGNVLAGGPAGAAAHQRPLAVLLAPGVALGQTRAVSASECSGSTTLTDYLEGVPPGVPAANAITTITVATPSSISGGSNNDQALWISSKDVFDRVKVRSDFKFDLDTLTNNIASCISNMGSIPASTASNKGIGDAVTPNTLIYEFNNNCPPAGSQVAVLANWQDNFLYIKPAGPSTVTLNNGATYSGCTAVLLFGGERTAGQTRVTALEKNDATKYLEAGTNATLFPGAGAYNGAAAFNGKNPTADIARCIKTPAAMQASFASNFGSFVATGVGVTPDNSVPSNPKVLFNNAAGTSGGCFWYPTSLPLAGKVVRLYYNYVFAFADPVGGADRGNGFSFQMVRGDIGAPSLPANPASEKCGTQANMGVLTLADMRGVFSLFVETDVHQDAAASNDPAENHTAIMYGGNLTHSATNGNPTTACDGTAAGCRHSPANTFEESPTPTQHSQRVEIHTGCDATCANCNMATPAGPNTRITAWVDCANCSDIRYDLDRAAQTPTISRCTALPASMNSVYFGLTSGFRSGGAQQGVTISKMNLISE